MEYWRHLDARLEERGFAAELIKPVPDSSLPIAVGATGEAEFVLSFNQPRGQIHVSLALSGNAGERIAQALVKDKTTIERDLGYSLTWEAGKGGSEIWITDEGIPIRDQNDWPVQHDWFGDRLEDFQRVFQPRVEALEQEALLDPKIRRELEHREFLTEYWRSCSAALAGTKLMIRGNDCLRGRDYCRLALLDDGVRLGTECFPGDKLLTVYLGVNGSAAPNQKRLFKQLVETQRAELSNTVGQQVEGNEKYLWVSLGADAAVRADWPRQHQWIKETGERFLEIFKARLEIP